MECVVFCYCTELLRNKIILFPDIRRSRVIPICHRLTYCVDRSPGIASLSLLVSYKFSRAMGCVFWCVMLFCFWFGCVRCVLVYNLMMHYFELLVSSDTTGSMWAIIFSFAFTVVAHSWVYIVGTSVGFELID